MLTTILVNAIRMGTIFLFGCLGEILTEKSGNLNLGIPGVMCIGTVGGAWAVSLYASPIKAEAVALGLDNPMEYVLEHVNSFVLVGFAILMTMIFAALAGMLYTFLTVTLHANQNVTGLALTTFGVGFMKFFAKRIYDQELFVGVSGSFQNLFGLKDSSNPFVRIFLSHGILVYIAIAFAIIISVFLKKTRFGLYLRAVGENPATADAVGINVSRYKYIYITVGSAIAGLGGLYYVMDRSSGTQVAEAAIDSFGWMAVALVIASMWKPLFALVVSIIFGGLSILDATLTTLSLSQQKIFAIFPYLLTVIVLIVTSVMKSRENQPPAALGQNYFREDR